MKTAIITEIIVVLDTSKNLSNDSSNNSKSTICGNINRTTRESNTSKQISNYSHPEIHRIEPWV